MEEEHELSSRMAKLFCLLMLFSSLKAQNVFAYDYYADNQREEQTSDESLRGYDQPQQDRNMVNSLSSSETRLENMSNQVGHDSKNVRKIVGVVTDEEGLPLPGASVVLDGSKTGTITDLDGKFEIIAISSKDKNLTISFVGMQAAVIPIKGKSKIEVTLNKSTELMDEVVVTGYQTINKTRMTGAVEVVTSKDIANKGYTSIGDVLRGSMAGVSTRNTSGKLGSQPEIRIRGLNSLYGNMNPTWIVDGVPFYGDLNDLIPEDIESITVLKDAAATAIYGSQAANGVIVVKRKQGREGKPYIRVASSFSFEDAPESKLDLMNSAEKIEFERSVYEDFPERATGGRVIMLLKDADMGKITHAQAEAEIARLSNINTNWYDVIFRTPFTQNHNVSFSGGTSKTKYYSSMSVRLSEGLVPSNTYNNYNGMLRIMHDFNKRLRFSFSLSSNYSKSKDSNASVSILHYATFANPYERPYDENGNYAYDRSYSSKISSLKDGYVENFNILNELYNNTSTSNALSNMASLEIELKILKNLKFVSNGSFSTSFSNSEQVLMPGTQTAASRSWIGRLFKELPDYLNNGSLDERDSRRLSYTLSNRLEYTQCFKEDHFVNLFLGQEVSESQSRIHGVQFPEYDPEKGLNDVPEIGEDKIGYVNQMIKNLMHQSESRSRSVSFFMSAGYSYKDRYVLSTSMRLDGADIIGTSNRFSPLWNASMKYNMHNEKFMKSIDWLSEFAFRFSYGYTGSIDKMALPFNVLTYWGGSKFFDETIPTTIRPKNPSVKWQKKQDRSFGLDLGFFRNRVRTSLNYYNNITKDLLDSKKLPVSVGISTIRCNGSSIRNYGFEFSLSSVNYQTRDFSWTTNFNIASNKSKVIKSYYKNIADVPKGYSKTEPVEGSSTSSWMGYRFAGIDPLTGHTLAYVDNTGRDVPIGFQRPDGTWVLDMDDMMNEKDKRKIKVNLGDSYPPIAGGFGTSVTWKKFVLSTRFVFMLGHKIPSAYYSVANGGSIEMASMNVLKKEANRWRKPGDITDMPRYNTSSMSSSLQTDWYDRKLESGDYLKCAEISLGYFMPQSLCSKFYLTSCRVNLNIRDIFTISKYKGLDPENFGGFGYPNSKKYMVSLSLGF